MTNTTKEFARIMFLQKMRVWQIHYEINQATYLLLLSHTFWKFLNM